MLRKMSSLCVIRYFGWTVMRGAESKGTARAIDNKPLVNHKRYYDYDPNDKYDDELRYKQYSVRFDVESAGEGFGIAANGYGIAEYGKVPDSTIPTTLRHLRFRRLKM